MACSKLVLRNWDLPAGTQVFSLFIRTSIYKSFISLFFKKSSRALRQVEMPPIAKGRKKLVADAKSNGITKSKQVEELPAANSKKVPRSGRLRKMAENEEMQEVEPIFDEAIAAAPENGTGKEVSTKDDPDVSEENVNGKVKEPEETADVPTKRGRKKAQASAQNEEILSDVITSTEAESEKVLDEQNTADHVPEKQEKLKSDERVESEKLATTEPEKVSGKRGRKKAVDPVLSNQDQVEESKAKKDAFKAVAGPSKRSRNVKVAVASVEAEDDGDFAPRKTRGGRNAKESAKETVPVAKGRKRKAIDEKGEVKETKKSKIVEEIQVDDKRQLRVDIQRNVELDEMAKNSSKEEEEILNELKEEEEDLEVKVKEEANSKAGRKRANKNAGDAKPAKTQKKEAADKKDASKSKDAPNTTTLSLENSSKSSDGQPWNFKIVSWNINGIRAWLEKDGLFYLHNEQPDVLCVQETKCSDAKLPPQLKEIEGYHCHWLAGEKDGYSGVGILYKKEPISIEDGIGIEEHDNEGRVITAEYEKFYLVTSYVPNAARGLTRLDYRMKWDEAFRAYLKKLDEKKPVILCGDLNVAHKEIDLANPKNNKKNAGFTQEERDGFSALLKEGFVDTFRHLYPDTKDAYTFWTYMMNSRAKNVGWRIDYFVMSERFTDHLCDSVIRKDVLGSDHCPIGLFLHV